MKGVVFTEFLSFVAKQHDDDFVDDLLHEAGLGEAAYTAVGTYEFAELAKLVGAYCGLTETPFPVALHAFGRHLADVFQTKFHDFYASQACVLTFLASIDDKIHVEVRKLYPDAELPRFTVVEADRGRLVVDYASCRPLADLAVGLIEGSSTFYKQAVRIDRLDIRDDAGTRQRFEIRVV